MEETKTTAAPSCQLISFVVDNSVSMQGEKLAAVMRSFRALAANVATTPAVEAELITFDGFLPKVIKSFEADEVGPVAAGRLPMLGRALSAAAGRLLARADKLTAEGVTPYRPWLFILSDGLTLDDLEGAVSALDKAERDGRLLYMPFRLSPKLLTERLQCLDRTKHMIEILPGHIPDFFNFVSAKLGERLASPEAGVKFSKSDFEGWALL